MLFMLIYQTIRLYLISILHSLLFKFYEYSLAQKHNILTILFSYYFFLIFTLTINQFPYQF